MRLPKVIISLVVTVAIMAVIFMLSAQNSGESGSLSDAVARVLANMFIADFDAMSIGEQTRIIADWAWPVRKTAHATEYGCLAISCFISCWQLAMWRLEGSASGDAAQPRPLRIALVAFAVTVVYACTDELHQLFIDGRAGQIADVLVDASGALIGCALCYAIMRTIAHMSRSR